MSRDTGDMVVTCVLFGNLLFTWLLLLSNSFALLALRKVNRKRQALGAAKRPSVRKVRSEAPTAENQKKQIAKNATFINELHKLCDYYVGVTDYQLQSFAPLAAHLWTRVPLTIVECWVPVMRQSVVVPASFVPSVSDAFFLQCFFFCSEFCQDATPPIHNSPPDDRCLFFAADVSSFCCRLRASCFLLGELN